MNLTLFATILSTIIYGSGSGYSSKVSNPYESKLSSFFHSLYTVTHDKSINKGFERNNYTIAIDYGESMYNHLKRYEQNLVNGDVQVKNGTPTYTAMLCSRADDTALNISKMAYVYNRASLFIMSNSCSKYRVNKSKCAERLRTTAQFSKKTQNQQKCSNNKYRTYDGFCNNIKKPIWGSTYTQYARLLPALYKDGIWEPVTSNPRITNHLLSNFDTSRKYSRSSITLALAAWTNIILYDLSHTVSYRMLHTGNDIMCCSEDKTKLAPRYRHPFCMPLMDKQSNCVNYVRSMLSLSDNQPFGAAQQMNSATHYLDGSIIYGTTVEEAKSIRLHKNGLIRLSFNSLNHSQQFTNADKRAIIDLSTTSLYTVLKREHNRLATLLSYTNPQWDDETLFQEARRIVIAEIQHITFNEWLPLVTGYKINEEYDSRINPNVYNSFANAAQLFATSLLGDELSLYNEDRILKSHMAMRYSPLNSKLLNDQEKLDSLLLALTMQNSQDNDLQFSEAITTYFCSDNNKTGLNAIDLIVQRGRDHGISTYASYRKIFGLPHESFSDLSKDIPLQVLEYLKAAYKNIDSIDLFIGGMAELPRNGTFVGPTFANIIYHQMLATKRGDRYFYDNNKQNYPFTSDQLSEIHKSSLARLMCDNSETILTIQPDAFHVPDLAKNKLVSCKEKTEIKKMNLEFWKQH